MVVLYNNMLQSLYPSQILTIGVVVFAIMVMFMILFRSFSLALLGIIPNLLAAGTVLSPFGLAGYSPRYDDNHNRSYHSRYCGGQYHPLYPPFSKRI
ncbi:MAG: hypothetical protein CM1200mP16_16450 [Nitrospina sp.]|nr:MAG: hypothetical protein CM1200mP16_16450 [Nitrospina sp.]